MFELSRGSVALLGAVTASALLVPSPALASDLCVGSGPGCFATIQDAVDAAADGDTIRVAPGTFAGGVTVDASVRLLGAGADRTVVRGGGPVLTIGSFGDSSPPTVAIRRMKITGGVTQSSPESVPFTGEDGVWASGAGIQIPPDDDFSGGATVTIRDSVISNNRAAPSATVDGGPPCPGGPCPFAMASGGGIESWGDLKLIDSTVSANRIGTASGLSDLASDVDGGGISSRLGSLSIIRSSVQGNQATATAPVGRFAEGGGIFADGATFTLRASSVSHNDAELDSGLPSSVEQLGIGGGIQIGGGVETARVREAAISGNSVKATNTVGTTGAFGGGFNLADIGIDTRVSDTLVARNEVTVAALNPSGGDAEGDTGGGNPVGVMTDSRLIDNEVRVRSAGGDATAAAAGSLSRGRLVGVAEIGNRAQASSPNGEALAAGGAIVVDSKLTLDGATIRANTASANGPSATARGGGIFDAPLFSNGGPLSLVDTDVVHNVATGPPSALLQGGGIYIPERRITVHRGSVAENVPDQICVC